MSTRFHTLNEFLEHLRLMQDEKEQKKKARDGSYYYVMHCPVHDGEDYDLTLKQVGSKVLLHCNAGCKQKHILDALHLRSEDLFLGGTESPHSTVETPSVIYNFIDDDGDLLHQIVWYKPEKFGQHRLCEIHDIEAWNEME